MTIGGTVEQEINGWFAGRLPDDWFEAAPKVTADRDEVLVVGRIGDVDLGPEASEDATTAARLARIKRFREDTREARMRIADEAERIFGRKVAWGAECGDVRRVFTNMAIPVMTRLRLRERAVLDTLIDAGVARSRSEALAWCVRLVGRNEAEWIDSLREALSGVEKARARGPAA
jgi:hypothetical protein